LVDLMFFQWLTGEAADAVTLAAASRNMTSTFRELPARHRGDRAQLLSDMNRAGLGEIGPGRGGGGCCGTTPAHVAEIASAATISALPLGTPGQHLAQEVHPGRCQDAPLRVLGWCRDGETTLTAGAIVSRSRGLACCANELWHWCGASRS
jgi:hypothetical protein